MKKVSLFLLPLALAGGARAAEPSYDQLKQQINQLQNRVDQLEAKQLADKDVDATVNQVLQDADRRSQLLDAEGFTAGYQKGKGFIIQDAAGNWSLHPFFQFQFRSTSNFRDDGKHSGNDNDVENGFEIRRMKVGFDGTAFSPNFYYYFRWNTSSSTGGLSLEEAWVRYHFSDDWFIRAGQFTNPAFHEQTTSSSKQLAVERSLVNQLITGQNQAYVQAISVAYDDKNSPIYAEAGLEDGFNSINSDFLDPNDDGKSDWGVFGRVNWFVYGDHKEYDDFTALNNNTDLLVFGVGGDITQTDSNTNYLHTVDAQWENTSSLGLYAAYLGDYVDSDAGSNYNWGVLAQAGFLLNPSWEIFGRYDYAHLDQSNDDSFNELTAGVNWYVGGGHNAKVTVDLSYLPDGSPTDVQGLGILASGGNEFLARGQFQLLL